MGDSFSGPTEADYRAADEVIASFGQIHPPTAGARERLAARCQSVGDSYFRLIWGLRGPANFREELILRRRAKVITNEQFGQIIRQYPTNYLTEELLRDFDQEVQQDLSIFTECLQHCYSVVHERYKPFVESDCDEALERLCSQLNEQSRFSEVELEFFHGFVAEARIYYQAGAVQIRNFPAASYATVVRLANANWKNLWEDRKQNRSLAPLLGFCKPCLEYLPRPQDLSAMLEQESALARMYLRQLKVATSSAQSVTADQVTINVNATELNLNSIVPPPTDKSTQSQASKPTLLKVNHWSELAIGIDAKGYWGLVPAPEFGGKYLKNNAVRLPLRSPRWKPLLKCLADSHDGATVRRVDLILELNLFPDDSDLPANYDGLDPDELAQLGTHAKATYSRLNNVLTELRQKLRDITGGPKGTGNTCLETVGEHVMAGFRVAYLLDGEEPGHYRFGDRK